MAMTFVVDSRQQQKQQCTLCASHFVTNASKCTNEANKLDLALREM